MAIAAWNVNVDLLYLRIRSFHSKVEKQKVSKHEIFGTQLEILDKTDLFQIFPSNYINTDKRLLAKILIA